MLKIKGQRMDNGEVQEFLDVDAPKSAELTEEDILVFRNSKGEAVFSVDLSSLADE